ncbi:DUF4390 domain-containing protein [Pararobbsia alpina]|uniref:Proline rich signal peptide protein n=1 Tax=Pararobbsia alpina TaxID=621374 RepID=A0A6S7B2Q6_9BURK|nr:DUF4390 domain-containing protein [Pararobbsia alpina]CAB3779057.1 hypothetical protein LMG28138_00766 [Pararobbsia alpina]
MICLRLFPLRWIALCCVALAMWMADAAQADTIAVERASLEADGSGWSLDARFTFGLNGSLEDAVNRGIPLYFTTEFQLTRGRWYWFDEEPVYTQQSIRLSFQPLTREYRVSSGGLQLAFPSLKDALAVVQHITSWHVIDRSQVSTDTTYLASVRMQLDVALMPKPFQIDAVNNRDWNLASDWKRFPFTVSDHGKQ